jgi:hypothetical protein
MGKEVKSTKLNPYYLCAASIVLLSAGFLMGPFPVFILAGFAPLYAIADHAEGENFWNKIELAGVALTIAFFAAHAFQVDALVASILQAIVLSIAFAAFTYSKQGLGARLGKLPLIFYILAVEYVFLKVGPGSKVIFLADAMKFKSDWTRWTSYTGYLGISLWILATNLLLYIAVLRKPFSMPFLVIFFIAVLAPIGFSYSLSMEGVTRTGMLNEYKSFEQLTKEPYLKNGEWVARTAAWVSVLILMFAFVKNYTSRK